ncbi:FlgD immunoglobulin-like domain containing protein [Chlamydiota bacterium]
MKKTPIILITIILTPLIFLTGCAQLKTELRKEAGPAKKPLIIENVSLAKKTVDLTKNEKIIIKYKLTAPAETVEVTFYNSINEVVAEDQYNSKPAGQNIIEWDGKNREGQLVVSDVYTYVIKAKTGKRIFTYNPAVRTGNKKLKIENARIDRDNLQVTYVLPEAAWVRLRLGLKEGALLNTLLDWAPEEAGRHIKSWSGWDEDDLIRFSKDPQTAVAITAFSLSSNSVIIKAGKSPDYFERYQKLITGKVKRYPLPVNREIIVREPEFSIELGKNYPVNNEGISVVSGKVPVRITISRKDKKVLVNSRFELVYFVDTVFLYEDEQAYTPFTYIWDTTGLKEGPHIFTINLLGYNTSVGIKSIKVVVKNK